MLFAGKLLYPLAAALLSVHLGIVESAAGAAGLFVHVVFYEIAECVRILPTAPAGTGSASFPVGRDFVFHGLFLQSDYSLRWNTLQIINTILDGRKRGYLK